MAQLGEGPDFYEESKCVAEYISLREFPEGRGKAEGAHDQADPNYKRISVRSWYGLAHRRRFLPPQWPKRRVLPCEGVSWGLPKTPNVEKEKKIVGLESVAPHHLAKASPLWVWRSFRGDVLTLLVWW